jgi:hypothetical protein
VTVLLVYAAKGILKLKLEVEADFCLLFAVFAV